MASASLVVPQTDIGPILKLSLDRHGVPTQGIFEVTKESTGELYFAVASPITEKYGSRETYLRVFTAFNHETFAAVPYLRLHTLAISHEDFLAVRRALRKGLTEARLHSLLQENEVIVGPTIDPKLFEKSGFIHISRLSNGELHLVFNPLDGQFGKGRNLKSGEELFQILDSLKVNTSRLLAELEKSDFASTIISAPLATLYDQGLI